MKYKTMPSKKVIFSMSPDNKEAYMAKAGEILLVETLDCYNGQIKGEDMTADDADDEFANPATGPIFIEGADAGDILKVEILDIIPKNYGIMAIAPGHGILGEQIRKSKTRIIHIEEGYAIFDERIKLPLDPMIGVIGTAPANKSISTIVPESHGGNMDCNKITKGSTLFLPVNVEGGMLALGDLHGIMGDGEVGGCGLEISGEVLLKVDVVKNKNLPLPMVINEKSFMCIDSKKTLDEASLSATKRMHGFLVNELEIDESDAAMLLSLVGELNICQIVDPLMTVRLEMPVGLLEINNYKI